MWYWRYEDAGVPVQLFQLISCGLYGKKDLLENRYCCPLCHRATDVPNRNYGKDFKKSGQSA